jgi:prephenate dehydratase
VVDGHVELGDKTSILAKLSDRPGSLYEFLQSFHEAKVNLKKIESRPAGDDADFDYWFYIDFEGFKGKPLTAFPAGRILVRRGSGHAWPIPTSSPA